MKIDMQMPGGFPGVPDIDELDDSNDVATRSTSAQRELAPSAPRTQTATHAGIFRGLPPMKHSGRRIDTRNSVRSAGLAPLAEETVLQGVDPLDRMAATRSKLPPQTSGLVTTVMRALDPSNLVSLVGSAVGAVSGALGGAAASVLGADPAKVDDQLRTLQRSVIGADFQYESADVKPSNLLQHLAAQKQDPIRSFWSDPAISRDIERPSAKLLGALEDLASTSEDNRLTALMLSFAFQGLPGKGRNENDQMEALAALREPTFVEDLTKAVVAMTNGRASASKLSQPTPMNLALKVLGRAAYSNQFPEMLQMLGHDGIDERTLDTLQSMMQACAALHGFAPGMQSPRAASASKPARSEAAFVHNAMLEAGQPQAEFERNAMHACARRLSVSDADLTPGEKAAIFAWQNGLRDVSPEGNLTQVKGYLEMLAEAYGVEDTEKSPLFAAKFGLGGADLRTLKEEAADVANLPDTPVVNALVTELRARTEQRIRSGGEDSDKAKLVAQLVALDLWTPDGRAQRGFELNDIVNGRGFDMSNPSTIEAGEIERYCREALASRTPAGGEQSSAAHIIDEGRLRALRSEAGNELAKTRMNLDRLGELAREYGINDEALAAHHGEQNAPHFENVLNNAHRVINGETASPEGNEVDDAVGFVQKFFSNAQFGNNVRYADAHTRGGTSRGVAGNIAPYIGVADAAYRPVLVRLNVQADNTETTAVRFGVATHGGEWSFGVEQHGLQYYGGGLQGGRSWGPQDHTGLSRIAGGGDIGGYGRDETNFKGIMIRSMRRLSDVRLDAPTPTFKHDDAKVRNEMAELQPKVRARARELIKQRNEAKASGRPFDVDIGEEMLRCLADEGMASGLSLGLVHQKTTNHRSDAAAAASFSMTTPGEGGARFGGGGNASVERVWSSKYEQTDTSGAVRIVNHREGSYYRLRSGASVSVNGFYGPAGFPPTDLASRSALLGEIGANAKVRFVYHKDKLVPRFCFSDAEFPDVTSYERYLQAHRDDWIEAFSYKHGGSREAGEKELSDHLNLVNDVRAVNHVNYARSRMVENFAKRHDQYRGIGALVPPGMSGFGAELEKARATLSESSDASQLVSGITYAPQAREQALGGALGYRGKEKIKTMTSEREIVFDSPGWAFMQLRENATSARVDPSGKVIKPGASAQEAAAQKLDKGKRVNRAAQDSGENDPVDHLPV